MISLTRCVGDLSSTEWTVLSRVLQASLWKQMITLVVGKSDRKRPGTLHLINRFIVTLTEYIKITAEEYHWSRGSGRLLCKEMISLAYWLKALFFQPSSINFLVSGSGLSNLTGLPISPGALGSRGGGTTPSACLSGSFFHLNNREYFAWRFRFPEFPVLFSMSLTKTSAIKHESQENYLVPIPFLNVSQFSNNHKGFHGVWKLH